MTQIDDKTLKQCFGAFMTGVTIVTTTDKNKNPIGFTANSFTSVSLTPPLLLVCIDNNSENLKQYTKGGFVINILAENQQNLAAKFADIKINRFKAVEWTKSKNENPILNGVAAYFDCSIKDTIIMGDHTLLVGEINNCASYNKAGLGYSNGQYFTRN